MNFSIETSFWNRQQACLHSNIGSHSSSQIRATCKKEINYPHCIEHFCVPRPLLRSKNMKEYTRNLMPNLFLHCFFCRKLKWRLLFATTSFLLQIFVARRQQTLDKAQALAAAWTLLFISFKPWKSLKINFEKCIQKPGKQSLKIHQSSRKTTELFLSTILSRFRVRFQQYLVRSRDWFKKMRLVLGLFLQN